MASPTKYKEKGIVSLWKSDFVSSESLIARHAFMHIEGFWAHNLHPPPSPSHLPLPPSPSPSLPFPLPPLPPPSPSPSLPYPLPPSPPSAYPASTPLQ